MAFRLGGRNSLAYVGVEPATPPNMVVINRPPTVNDSQNFNIGTFWVVPSTGTPPEELWILISLVGGVATWVQLYPSNAGGASQFVEDVGIANELAGVINIIGGATSAFTNINTFGSGNTVEIRLNDTIQLPDTTSGGGQGALFLGGSSFLHNFGSSSTFLGERAGSLTNSLTGNTGIGTDSLSDLTTGNFNTSVGSNSLPTLTSGSSNIALGFSSGLNYTIESNNIVIDNNGTVADSAVIRIGTSQDDCFIQGIFGSTVGATNAQVFVDNTGKLGTVAGTDGGNLSFMGAVNGTEALTGGTSISGTFFVGAQKIMTIVYDNFSGAFDPGDGVGTAASFTAPVTGFYQFNWNVQISPTTSGVQLIPIININSTPYISLTCPTFSGSGGMNKFAQSISTVAQLTANDVVTFSANIAVSLTNPGGGFEGGTSPFITAVYGILLKTL